MFIKSIVTISAANCHLNVLPRPKSPCSNHLSRLKTKQVAERLVTRISIAVKDNLGANTIASWHSDPDADIAAAMIEELLFAGPRYWEQKFLTRIGMLLVISDKSARCLLEETSLVTYPMDTALQLCCCGKVVVDS